MGVVEQNGRYDYRSLPSGVSEDRNLDFHSPYGCSKGSADQYVIDYHRIYGLRTIVFRQSCIYGYRQFGAEDQGWVAWFMIASQLGRPITIYGDGKQVRDILFIDDLAGRLRCRLRRPRPGGRQSLQHRRRRQQRAVACWNCWLISRSGSGASYRSAARTGGRATRKSLSAISAAPRPNWLGPKISCPQGLELLYDWVAENQRAIRGTSARCVA